MTYDFWITTAHECFTGLEWTILSWVVVCCFATTEVCTWKEALASTARSVMLENHYKIGRSFAF